MILKVTLIGLLAGVLGTGAGGILSAIFRKEVDRYLNFCMGLSGGIMLAVVVFDLMKEERERIKSDEDALLDTMQKWYTDISDIEDLIVLGEYLHVYNKIINKRNSAEVDDLEKVKNNITSLLANDNALYQRYVKWQESDEYIKSFAEKNLNIEER